MTVEATIQSLLKPLAAGGCYPLTAPDPVVKPYIVFQIISDVQENGLDGYLGISNKRMQIDAYATAYGAVKTLAGQIKAAMSTAALSNLHLSSQDMYEPETQLYRITMDYSIWSE